eukprot:TRINITY_DN5824_c0_g1_i1.p1 TRINITY_DN5824_c0_g1~~TRINITY_DN5824_c0_g1_i1.p1  ORF type:complete len:803 (+),score=104.96 TRINITY_DN5824_c0_g1_i1:273-2681(+)
MAPRLKAELKHVPIGSCPHDVQCIPFGPPGSSLYRAAFVDVEDNNLISPWHDIALHQAEGRLACVCSTPAGSWARYELAEDEPFNPIRIRKATAGPRGGVACTKIAAHSGKTSHLAHFSDNAPWNHGFLPQTAAACTLHGTAPLHVIEIGAEIQRHTGEVYFVKPLGAIPVEEGQPTLTWKILAIAVDDPMAPVLWDWTDMEEHLPGILVLIKDWLRTSLCSEAGEKESIVHIQRPARFSQTLAKVAEYHQTWKHFQLHRHDNVTQIFRPNSPPITDKLLEAAWKPHTTRHPFLSIPLHPLTTHVLFDDKWLTDAYYTDADERVSERNTLQAPAKVSAFRKATRKLFTFFNLSAPSSSTLSTPYVSKSYPSLSKTVSFASATSPSRSHGRRHPSSQFSSFDSNDEASSPIRSPLANLFPTVARRSHEGFVRPTPIMVGTPPSTGPRHRSSLSSEYVTACSSPCSAERRLGSVERKGGSGEAKQGSGEHGSVSASVTPKLSGEIQNSPEGSAGYTAAYMKAGEEVGKAMDAIRAAQEELDRQRMNCEMSLQGLPRAFHPIVDAHWSLQNQQRLSPSGGGSGSDREKDDVAVRENGTEQANGFVPRGEILNGATGTGKPTVPAGAYRLGGGVEHPGAATAASVDHSHDHTAVLTAMRVAKLKEEKRKRHERHQAAKHSPKPTPSAAINKATAGTASNNAFSAATSIVRTLSLSEKKETVVAAAIVDDGMKPERGSTSSSSGRTGSDTANFHSDSDSDSDDEDERWGGGEGGLKKRIALTRSLSFREETMSRVLAIDSLPKYDSD